MEFHGEYIDTLVNADTKVAICSSHTSELQEWLRVHPQFHRHNVLVHTNPGTRIISVEEYLKLPNVYGRNP